MQLLDGRAVATAWQDEIAREARRLSGCGHPPGLAVILVGDDPASRLYTSMKQRVSQSVGFHSRQVTLPAAASTKEVISAIEQINADPTIDGILVQLPLPDQVDTDLVLATIDPAKDADGLHPYNLGQLLLGHEVIVPATPRGILRLLDAYHVGTEGKHVVIVGRSNILGKPLAVLFLNRNATVTICHSKTDGLANFTRQGDIVTMDTGVPGLLSADMVSDQAIVVDAGISQLPNGKVVGDTDFAAVSAKVAAITPVPGGVGPMTIAALLDTTLQLARQRRSGPQSAMLE